MQIEFTIDQVGVAKSVTLDGVECANALRGLTFYGRAGEMPRVDLDPLVSAVHGVADGVIVHIPRATRDMLVKLGWTPPSVEGSGGISGDAQC